MPDLFPGFDSRRIDTGDVTLFCRAGGSGPPLLLLHGYPQTHHCWHKAAPRLAEHFTLVLPDLRGYGESDVAAADATHRAMSKRAMAADLVRLMAALGHARFAVAGHDRGGRVAYRMAFDQPERLTKAATLDIVPTHAMWDGLTARLAMKTYHWLFLAQAEPLPETLIAASPRFYLEWTLRSWTRERTLDAFHPDALAEYRRPFDDPRRIHALCEDYRAGQTVDLADDAADVAAGRRITVPLLALWGAAGIPGETDGPLDIWRRYAADVTGQALDCGHFLPEEAPDATADALLRFLG